MPLPIVDEDYRVSAILSSDDEDVDVELSESGVRRGDASWEMPDLWTAGLVASILVDAEEVSVPQGDADVVASLIFGWEGGSNDEVYISGDLWNGVFPGVDLIDAYEVEGESFNGDDSSPLTSGRGHVGLVRLAGRYWGYIWTSGDFVPDWSLLNGRTLDEARAEFIEGYTLG